MFSVDLRIVALKIDICMYVVKILEMNEHSPALYCPGVIANLSYQELDVLVGEYFSL